MREDMRDDSKASLSSGKSVTASRRMSPRRYKMTLLQLFMDMPLPASQKVHHAMELEKKRRAAQEKQRILELKEQEELSRGNDVDQSVSSTPSTSASSTRKIRQRSSRRLEIRRKLQRSRSAKLKKTPSDRSLSSQQRPWVVSTLPLNSGIGRRSSSRFHKVVVPANRSHAQTYDDDLNERDLALLATPREPAELPRSKGSAGKGTGVKGKRKQKASKRRAKKSAKAKNGHETATVGSRLDEATAVNSQAKIQVIPELELRSVTRTTESVKTPRFHSSSGVDSEVEFTEDTAAAKADEVTVASISQEELKDVGVADRKTSDESETKQEAVHATTVVEISVQSDTDTPRDPSSSLPLTPFHPSGDDAPPTTSDDGVKPSEPSVKAVSPAVAAAENVVPAVNEATKPKEGGWGIIHKMSRGRKRMDAAGAIEQSQASGKHGTYAHAVSPGRKKALHRFKSERAKTMPTGLIAAVKIGSQASMGSESSTDRPTEPRSNKQSRKAQLRLQRLMKPTKSSEIHATKQQMKRREIQQSKIKQEALQTSHHSPYSSPAGSKAQLRSPYSAPLLDSPTESVPWSRSRGSSRAAAKQRTKSSSALVRVKRRDKTAVTQSGAPQG